MGDIKTLDGYLEAAMSFNVQETDNPLYMLMEMCEELGELQGKFAKAMRCGLLKFDDNDLVFRYANDKVNADHFLDLTKKEVGDILWGIAGICSVMGWTMDDVAAENIDKIADRFSRGVINGDGDER